MSENFEDNFDLQDTHSDYPAGHPNRRWSDRHPEPLKLRTPEYDYTKGAPEWTERVLLVVMALGVVVSAFYLGYMLGVS